MYHRISKLFVLNFLVIICKVSNDPQVVNELIDTFIHDRINKLCNSIPVGNITFAGMTLEDATLEGLHYLKRDGDFTVWDWDVDSWSEIYGDLKADCLILKSSNIIIEPDTLGHTGWVRILNPTIHIHYEANFTDYPNCRLEKELISWSWIDDLIITDEGELHISEDEIKKLKLALIPEAVQLYFRKLFMEKCLQHFYDYPASYYFPVIDHYV